MNESRFVPLSAVVIVSLWLAVAALLITSWIVLAADAPRLAQMLASTAVAGAVAAGVATIRDFAIRTRGLIRSLYGLDGSNPSPEGRRDLRPLR